MSFFKKYCVEHRLKKAMYTRPGLHVRKAFRGAMCYVVFFAFDHPEPFPFAKLNHSMASYKFAISVRLKVWQVYGLFACSTTVSLLWPCFLTSVHCTGTLADKLEPLDCAYRRFWRFSHPTTTCFKRWRGASVRRLCFRFHLRSPSGA